MSPGNRLLLVDDHKLLRQGLRRAVEEAGFEVVGEAGDGEEAVRLAIETHPDLVLMDVTMPVLDGIEATRRIAVDGGPRVVILTTFERDDYLFAALEAGASGFLLKSCTADELVSAIRSVAGGHALLAPAMTRRVIERATRRPAVARDDRLLQRLTDRESDVLTLLAGGLSNAEIADELVLGTATVKSHVSAILTKLDLRDRVQAVVVAYRSGLVPPSQG
jgi:DNA-binding NarL/FixJ family response regulator